MSDEAKRHCLGVMNLLNFERSRRISWWIWASKHRACPTCKEPPYKACLNMNELNKGRRRKTRWPHDPRVDWAKMLDGMRTRGYFND
jgi:hypothetical protein